MSPVTARAVMVLGTTSGAGKSWLTTALCRYYSNLGLKVAPPALTPGHPLASDATRIEELAVHELEGLLDPALSEDERERRIRRLTDGGISP